MHPTLIKGQEFFQWQVAALQSGYHILKLVI
jgi:hypothetical protein